jgi:DNA polymerase III delta subunit
LDGADAALLKAPWFAEGLAQGRAGGNVPGGGDDAGVLADGLEGLLAQWVEGNHLVCACASADQRKKLTKLFAERGEVLDFRRGEKSSQPAVPPAPFLRQLLNQRKLSAPNAVAQRMVAAYGADLGLLTQELAKLEAHAWPRTELTDADLAAVGSPRPEENVFKLIDALGQQKLGEALRLTREFIAADPEARYQLMGLMIAEVRKLLFMRALIDENRIPARGAATFDAFRMQIHPRLGKELPPAAAAWWKKTSPWALHQTLTRARGFKTSQLAALVPLLADGDLAFKTGRRKPEDLLEDLCARLCGVREEATL